MGTATGITFPVTMPPHLRHSKRNIQAMQQPATSETVSSRTAVLIASLASSFLTPFMVSSVNIALPTIGRDLHIGAISLSWVTTSYLLCSTVLLIPFGQLADRYGRKKFFSIGITIATVSALLSALSGNGPMLIATRILHGIGAAMIFGTGMAMLTSVYPPNMRGKMLGINVSFTYLGLSLGPPAGGLLTRYFGWHSIFAVVVPAGIALLVIVTLGIKQEWKQPTSDRFDGIGASLYGATLSLLLVGFSRLSQPVGIVLIILGSTCALMFIAYESRVKNPVLPIRFFVHNRLFAFSNAAAFINYSATYAVGFLISFYLQYIKGLPADKAGLFMIIQPVVMVLGSPVSGRLSDRVEPGILASIGMGCCTAGLVLLAFLTDTTPLSILAAILVLTGFGFALFSSPNTSAVMGSVDRNDYGIASATVGTMRLSGQVVSMGCITLLASIIIGDGAVTPDRYPQFLVMMHRACTLFAGLCSVGVVVSLIRGKTGR